ncbi:hypothetical protein [Halalkalibacter alkalisediminis]|uniref:Uncharacterized protein n=1 Tax=Halalkalibacter alkalisediminis TaxID=935616 RepID=A0ABV6NH94_9BACI
MGERSKFKKTIIGSQSQVKRELENLIEHYKVDEIMVITNTLQFEDRLKSYELLASCL